MKIKYQMKCRHNPSYTTTGWCNLPSQWKEATGVFKTVSNNICRLDLNYDPLINVVAYLYPYEAVPVPGTSVPQCCGFVADNAAWFMIYLKTKTWETMELDIRVLRMANLTIKIGSGSEVTVYNNGVWSAHTMTTALFPAGYRTFTCDGVDRGTAGCGAYGYPVIWYKVFLDSAYMGLRQSDLPVALYMKAGVRVEYAWKGKTQLQDVQISTLIPEGVLHMNDQLSSTSTTAVAAASNNLMFYVGVSTVGLASVGLVSWFVMHYRKKKRSAAAHKKLEETTATA
jgi:hypothetical protein